MWFAFKIRASFSGKQGPGINERGSEAAASSGDNKLFDHAVSSVFQQLSPRAINRPDCMLE